MNQLDQGIGIRVLELRVLPILHDLSRQFMVLRQFVQHVDIGAGPCFRLLDDWQLQLVEQHVGQLQSRVDIEWLAGQLINLDLQLFNLFRKFHT